MSRDELLARISINPNIYFGKPRIKGHRIWVWLVLDLLERGWSFQQVLQNYPGITEDDPGLHRIRGRDVARAVRRCSCRERDVKIKLDENLDFSNPLRFPPWDFSGIAVLRAKANSRWLLPGLVDFAKSNEVVALLTVCASRARVVGRGQRATATQDVGAR